MPLFSPRTPPLITSHSTSSPFTVSTSSSIRPSESRMRAPDFEIFGQRRKCRRNHAGGAGDIARRDSEALPRLQLNRFAVVQPAGADLRSLQIAQDTDVLALLLRHLADHFDEFQLLRMGAMREVQARDIQACADQLAKSGFIVRSRPESGNNLGSARILSRPRGRAGIRDVHPSPNCCVSALRSIVFLLQCR